jgi:hypothetical protein
MVIDDNSQFDKVDRGYSDTVVLAFVLNGERRRLVYVPRLCWDTGQQERGRDPKWSKMGLVVPRPVRVDINFAN